MDSFWDWVAGFLGREKAFSLRVWVDNWSVPLGGAVIFCALAYVLAPYLFETRQIVGYVEGRVVSSAGLPGDEELPPGASFVMDIGQGKLVQISTRNMQLAETVRDTGCLRQTIGDATAITRYALAPQGFCKVEIAD